MKIAIIGSGFFGISAALVLQKEHDVDIYEIKHDILQGASATNQFRFHRGYHYPRSPKTIDEISKSFSDFTSFYGNSFFDSTTNYYLVAKNESYITFDEFVHILTKHKLKFIRQKDKFLLSDKVSEPLLVDEKILNYFTFKNELIQRLKKTDIKLKLNSKFKKNNLQDYDKVIIATYCNNNTILKELNIDLRTQYQYELVEKIIVKLPNRYKNLSCVVIDGAFVNIDPYLGTEYHLLSDVKYSKIEKSISYEPTFNNDKKNYINRGVINDKKQSNFDKFIEHGREYLDFLAEASYIGSFYTVRTILPHKEKTDERPTHINLFEDKKFISIFSGKWNSCVSTAHDLYDILRD